MKQIKMLLLVGTVVLFTACGGGGSSRESGSNPSGGNPIETLTLNEALKSKSQTIAAIQDQMYDAIGLLSDNYTKVIDAKSMTIDEADAFYDKLKLMEPDIANAVLLDYQISLLSSKLVENNGANISKPFKNAIPEMGFVVTGTAIVVAALAAYSGYTVYNYGVESKKKLYNSVEYLIDGSKEKSNLLKHIKEVLKLPESTTKSETLLYFRLLNANSKKESVSRTLIDDASSDYAIDASDALLHHKENVVKVAQEGAKAGFVAVVAGHIAVGIGGVSGSAAARVSNVKQALPGTAIPDYTGVTIHLTAAETGAAMTGGAAGGIAVVVNSKQRDVKQVPKPEVTMTKEQALEQLRKIKEGIIGEFGLEEIGSAVITVVREIAKKTGSATNNEDGSITIEIPKKSQTIFTDKEKIEEGIEVQKTEESDIIVVPENTKPVMASNVDLSDEYIEIRIPLQEGTTVEPNSNEWVQVDSRWWERHYQNLEIEENLFYSYSEIFPSRGYHSYGVHYFDGSYVPPVEGSFGTEENWTVPPQILIPGKEYSMDATIKRTEGTNVFYRENEIIITIDDYKDDDYSCMTSGDFEKLITTKRVYVTSNPSDLSENSWKGKMKAPNVGEYNDKFQVEVSFAGGCTRYVYERKD